jgi:hypothetical protein
VRKHVNEQIFPSFNITHSPIALRTAERWMKRLGYKLKLHKKGIYYDGHERDDVVAYRVKFLEKVAALKPYVLLISCLQWSLLTADILQSAHHI